MPPIAKGQIRTLRHPDGSVRKNEARVRFRNGARPWVEFPATLSGRALVTAVARYAEGAKTRDYFPKAKRAVTQAAGERVADYFKRWMDEREAAGNTSLRSDRSRFEHHVKPFIGDLPMRLVSSDDIETLRDALDTKVRTNKLAWKTAANVWTLVTAMFKSARGAKRRDLRVPMLIENPSADVEAPERGERKAKQYLYPSEFLRFVDCNLVPMRWRLLAALAVYTYARAGELEVLEWSDVDLEHGLIVISRTMQADGTEGPPKNGKARRVPIEPNLRPLLDVLHAKAKGKNDVAKGLVCDIPKTNALATVFRETYLRRAGIARAALYAANRTHTPITFHDLRATGLTWCAVRGDEPAKLQSRAGHKLYATTALYVREAEDLGPDFGAVFPPLPARFLQDAAGSIRARGSKRTEKPVETGAEDGT